MVDVVRCLTFAVAGLPSLTACTQAVTTPTYRITTCLPITLNAYSHMGNCAMPTVSTAPPLANCAKHHAAGQLPTPRLQNAARHHRAAACQLPPPAWLGAAARPLHPAHLPARRASALRVLPHPAIATAAGRLALPGATAIAPSAAALYPPTRQSCPGTQQKCASIFVGSP